MNVKSFSSKIKKLLLTLIFISSGFTAFADDYFVCLGSYKKIENAKNLSLHLEEAGIENFISEFSEGEVKLYRVLHKKAFQEISQARSFRTELLKDKSLGLKDLWVVKNPEVYEESKAPAEEAPKTKIINKDIKVKINLNLEHAEPEPPAEDTSALEAPAKEEAPQITEPACQEIPAAVQEAPLPMDEPHSAQEEAAPVAEEPLPAQEETIPAAETPAAVTPAEEEPAEATPAPVQEEAPLIQPETLPKEEPASPQEPVSLPVEKEPVQIEELPVVKSDPVISRLLTPAEVPVSSKKPALISEEELPDLSELSDNIPELTGTEDELPLIADLPEDIPVLAEPEEPAEKKLPAFTEEPDQITLNKDANLIPVQYKLSSAEEDTSFFLMV